MNVMIKCDVLFNLQFFITNLGLHKYKISESDKGDNDDNDDSDDSLHSDHVEHDENNLSLDEIKPALDALWKDILDYRLIITAPQSPNQDILGFIDIPRVVTMTDPPTMKFSQVKITDVGFI